jgi:hypothetical protein
VPAGSDRTTVIEYWLAPEWQRREYWSEQLGLLKVELYRADGGWFGSYVLASVTP